MDIKEQHWFCFSFSGKTEECGSPAEASQYCGLESKKIPKAVIDHALGLTPLDTGGVLISATYLGFMTKEEFSGS